MPLVEIAFQIGNDGQIVFNPIDSAELSIASNSLVKVMTEDRSGLAVLRAHVSDRSPRDKALADPNILTGIGINEGDMVELEPFVGMPLAATKVSIEFSMIDREPNEMYLEENKNMLLDFIESYLYMPQTELYWPRMNARLKVQIVEPVLKAGEVAAIYRVQKPIISLREQISNMPFNAIMIIDKSRSMTWHDVKLDGADVKIKELQKILIPEEYDSSRYSGLHDLFARLLNPDNSPFMNGSARGVSRIDAVMLSMILYFQLKMARGFGEKCAFVIYADDPLAIDFNGKEFIEASEFNAKTCDYLVRAIKDSSIMGYGKTIMSKAILKTIDIARAYQRINNRPLMVLILTDGKPGPMPADSYEKVVQATTKLKETLKEEKIPFLIYTIGIGVESGVDVRTLDKVAKMTNGAFHFAKSVKDLSEWYEKLATNFTQNIVAESNRE
jgi:hypothetical protein